MIPIVVPASPEPVCVQPNGAWCFLHELKDYQEEGDFFDYEIMSYECMMNLQENQDEHT